MTLLFLTPRHSSGLGGVEKHVRLLTRELEKRGHGVVEMSLDEDASLKSATWKKLWDKRRLIERADLVHVHDVFWWYLPFRLLYPRKPVFTTLHGWEGVYPPTRSAIFQKKLAQRLSRGTIGVGTFFHQWYGVKPTFTTFGVLDPQVKEVGKRLRMPETIKSIVFFGRLEEVNGIDVATPALIRLSRVGHQVQFIGDGSGRKHAETIGSVTGMVVNPWRFIAASDLVIASSYLSMLETAALAHPVVSIATNPLKRDYLFTHPLAPFITIVSSSEELFKTIQSFDISKHRNKIRAAQSWTFKQTPRKMADLYEKSWKDV